MKPFCVSQLVQQLCQHRFLSARFTYLLSRYAAVTAPMLSSETPLAHPRPAAASAKELAPAATAAGDRLLLPPVSSTSSSIAAPSLDPARIESVGGVGEGRPPRLAKVDVEGEDRA